MEFSWLYLLAAIGGGIFGAAVGAVPAFVLAGVAAAGTFAFATITGTQPDLALTPLSGLGPFGPWLSPNIAFAVGIGAIAVLFAVLLLLKRRTHALAADDAPNTTEPIAA